MLSSRYNRQILLKGFGTEGQENLNRSRVLVIGAGGLGCPVLQILAGSGIGLIGIVDFDRVSSDNLSRQILYNSENIGEFKVVVAARYLRKMNPEIRIEEMNLKLEAHNALEIMAPFDILVDGTDNFETRYMINDAAVILGKPLIYGAVSEFEGQMAVWNFNQNGIISLNYRDAFPKPPHPSSFQNCNELGVLGVLTSIIGSLMASEVVKIASKIGQPYINRIWSYNSFNHTGYEFKVKPRSGGDEFIPRTPEAFKRMNYPKFCSLEPIASSHISTLELKEKMKEEKIILIDVREPGETPLFSEWEHIQIPLGKIRERGKELKGETLVTFCATGKRSDQAVRILKEILGQDQKIYSLEGGLMHWRD